MTRPIKRPPAKTIKCSVCKDKVLKNNIVDDIFGESDNDPLCIRCYDKKLKENRGNHLERLRALGQRLFGDELDRQQIGRVQYDGPVEREHADHIRGLYLND